MVAVQIYRENQLVRLNLQMDIPLPSIIIEILLLSTKAAEKIANDAAHYAAMPENAPKPIFTFHPHHLVDLLQDLAFHGQLRTCPSMAMPDSHNAGDFGTFLVGAPHPQAITAEDLHHRTDGHMDIDGKGAGLQA